MTKLYGLKVESIGANKKDNDFTTKHQTWKENPKFCCEINKVNPLQLIKERFIVWVSGLMEWQSDHRSSLNILKKKEMVF